MKTLEEITLRCLEGEGATVDEALALAETESLDALRRAADEVTRALHGRDVDTCSIVNARSGRCGEDCKWCAQSARHHTGVDEYGALGEAEVMRAARLNAAGGVRRFSLVTSGRRVTGRDLESFCASYRRMAAETPLHLCASMGLLGLEELKALKEAGVERYHCNLETSRRFFPSLCTTHTYDDKLRTIALAREAGLEVCSGGIIGMGETLRDRLEMTRDAFEAGAVSIPVNILNPIAGTPLEHTPLISEEEVELTVALMRLVAPRCVLRFAGGRLRLSRESLLRILRGGMNGALVGDLLTTVGNTLEQDRSLMAEAGLTMAGPASGRPEEGTER